MSKKGENIYKRKDGRWEARYSKGSDPSGRIRYGYCYAPTYREVREKRNAAKAALLRGGLPDSNSRKRFGSYCEEWLCVNRSRIKASTYAKYKQVLEQHIRPELGDCMTSALSTALVGQFGQELLDNGLSPKTVRLILTVVHSVIEYMRSQEPGLQPVKVIYPKDNRKETRVLSREEQQRLTAYLLCKTDDCKLGVLLASLTGLRLGEVCALRWGDISLKDRTLTVSRTLLRLKDEDPDASGKTRLVLDDPKSRASARVIPLTESTANLCGRWEKDPAAFVLTGESGRPMEPRTLQYRLKRYAEACGLEGVHFHVLRHTFATRCIEVGFEVKSLSEILGHTSPKFTLERYVHSSMDLKRDNMDKLAAIGC